MLRQLLHKILYGSKPNFKELDKLAQARPIHQGFDVLAKELSKNKE